MPGPLQLASEEPAGLVSLGDEPLRPGLLRSELGLSRAEPALGGRRLGPPPLALPLGLFGDTRFPLAAVYGSALTSAQLDQPPNVDAYKAFMPDFSEEFDGLETRPVSHIVDDAVMVTPAVEVIPAQGHTPGNLLVRVPAAGILFAGGMCSFGVTPLAFQGDPLAWAQALTSVAELADTIVPGHGPVGGPAQVQELQAYLLACVDADGDPRAIPAGPWDSWTDRELDAINVERAYLLSRGEDRIPPSMLRAIGGA